MIVYVIEHTEAGEKYPKVAEQDVTGLVGHIDGIASYLCVGDSVTVSVVEMTQDEYDSLQEFH